MRAPDKPVGLDEERVESFDLLHVAEELMGERAFRESGRVARALARSDRTTAVVTVIDDGVEIHERVTDAPTIVSVLSGSIVVSAGRRTRPSACRKGSAVVLAAACPHRVKATEPSDVVNGMVPARQLVKCVRE